MIFDAARDDAVDFFHLRKTNSCVEVCGAKIKAWIVKGKGAVESEGAVFDGLFFFDFGGEVLCPSVTSKLQQQIIEVGIVGAYHAAFDGGCVVPEVKGEGAECAEVTDLGSVVAGAGGGARVFHQRESVSLLEVEDGLHIAGHAEDVHQGDGAGVVGLEEVFELVWIEAEGCGIDIAHDGLETELDGGSDGSGPAHGGHDDFSVLERFGCEQGVVHKKVRGGTGVNE